MAEAETWVAPQYGVQPMGESVSDWFDAMVAAHADRPAVSFRSGTAWATWTYASLRDRALAIAEHLRRRGARAGEAIVVVARRHPDTIASFLAALRLGCCYVPVDPRDPPARRDFVLDAVGARMSVESVQEEGGDAQCIITPSPLAQTAPQVDASGSSASPGDRVAYVMFTSGSTGHPKGAVVPHRAVLRLVRGQDYVRFGPDRVFLQSIPLAFDASGLEIYGALLHGGRLVLFPADMLPNAAGLREVIAAQGVTTACFTASLFHALVDGDVACLGGLQEIVIGGERLSVPHVRRALAALPGTQLVNGYGPTENGVQSTSYRVPAVLPPDLARIPIGVPLRGTEVLVVDEQLREQPVGVPGELVLLGDGLANGYVSASPSAGEAFVTVSREGQLRRAYRTGDRGVQLADGNFDFLGRIDRQVKIQGHRVEPEEVEQRIGRLSSVAACRVIVATDPAGASRLVAYVVMVPGSRVEAIEAAVAAHLPSYLVPSRFLAMDVLPIGGNGKVDDRALPSPWPEADASERAGGRVAATPAALRRAVEAAWRDVLGRDPGRTAAGFFEIGGRSLDAVRLHERLEQASGRTLEPTFVYEFPTRQRQVEALTRRVAEGS